MAPRMADFFDRLERAAPDERTRAAVRHDRDIMDLACYRGQVPPGAEFLFHEADPLADTETLAVYGTVVAEMSDEDVERHAAEHVEQMTSRLGSDRLRALARDVDPQDVRSFFVLLSSMDAFDERFSAAMERQFLAVIARRTGSREDRAPESSGAPEAPAS